MIGSWFGKRNELLAITACSCTFGAIMLEVGIYAAQRDYQAATTEPGSTQFETALKSTSQGVDIDTGMFHALGSPERDPLLRQADWEFRTVVGQVLELRKMLLRKLLKKQVATAASEEADLELRAAVKSLHVFREKLISEIMEQEAPAEESKDASEKKVGDSR